MSATAALPTLPAPPEPIPAAAAAAPEAAPPTLWKRMAPLVFFEGYLNASLLIFVFGPWIWPLADMTKLVTFVMACHLALAAGYLSGAFKRPMGYHGSLSSGRLLRLSVGLTLILYFPTMMWLGGGVFDPIGAIRDPATAYYRFQAMLSEERPTTMISYLRALVSPILSLAVPLVAVRWKKEGQWMRALGVAAVLSSLSVFVFTGRNKGMIDFLLLLPWLVIIAGGGGRIRRINPVRAGLLFLVVLVGFNWFVDFYTRGNAGRAGGIDNPYWVRLFGGMEANPENAMIRYLPPEGRGVVLGLSFNQTHGYYALALALEKPFEPAWGLGHSYVLQSLQERFTGQSDARTRSYPGRLESEDGWSITEFWHTTYTWIASDASFPGTVVVIFLLGRLFARTWIDTLRGDNPYAAGLLVLVITIVYYLPTNNIVLGQPEGFAGFWGLLILWLVTRRRITLRKSVSAPVTSPAPAGATFAAGD